MRLSLLSSRIFLHLKQNILPFISFSELHFSQVPQKKIPFYYIRNIPAALEDLHLGVLGRHLLIRLSNAFYHFLYFREITFASLHIYYLRVFVLITYLQCYIFIIFHLFEISEEDHISSP